jgi:hypothetical protein
MGSARRISGLLAALAVLYAALMFPDHGTPVQQRAAQKPFAWSQDEFWAEQEGRFLRARRADPAAVDAQVALHFRRAERVLQRLESADAAPGDSLFASLEREFFSAAALVAARPRHAERFTALYNRARVAVKRQSRAWDVASRPARDTLYRLLYGMRAAVEEVLLQTRDLAFPPAMLVSEAPSAAPAADILGIKVHSGDLLVSRGGAEVSALISRGNDYPGNFSHVALVYVDADGGASYVIESHIERGVAVASVEQYVRDRKLRFMVLRARADLPRVALDPLLPHKAARTAYEEARLRHIPYDFKMNFHDPAAMFCSEVGSYAYGRHGIELWQGVSTISSQGVVNWLHAFGVEHFVTQMPSDLEYDPQLAVVAEWRDPQTLLEDHIDNAVMDVLLERADAGEELGYSPWRLPVARALKGYCVLRNLMGRECLIPEGMSATQALKSHTFTDRHARLARLAEQRVRDFVAAQGYVPPYWQLVRLAREAEQQRR